MIQLHFGEIYGTKYESLIDNYSFYFLGTAGITDRSLNIINPERAYAGNGGGGQCGLRILITLPNNVKVSEESVGTKTITSRGADYTYNVWNIE